MQAAVMQKLVDLQPVPASHPSDANEGVGVNPSTYTQNPTHPKMETSAESAAAISSSGVQHPAFVPKRPHCVLPCNAASPIQPYIILWALQAHFYHQAGDIDMQQCVLSPSKAHCISRDA
jgi:hypothetical protein